MAYGRRTALRRLMAGLVLGALAGLLAAPAYAEGGHTHTSGFSASTGGTMVWGLISLGGVFIALAASRFLLISRAAMAAAGPDGRQLSYWAAIRQFSRNAKLFLAYSLMAELGTGIWGVMFNLYLLRSGFPITFIGTFWLINMIAHGAASLPMGLIADRFGRRRAFFIATFIAIGAQGTLLFTQEPGVILLLAGIAGVGEAAHGVTGAPFMMENSEQRERSHLFSLNSSFLQLSRFWGNMAGGMLPLVWATTLGVPQVDPAAARWALVSGLPLTVLALVPLAFMREKKVELVETFRDLVTMRNIEHRTVIAQLVFLSLFTGTAFGLTVRFFNIFFGDAHNASDGQIGAILGLGSLASAGAVLIAPAAAARWGKARSIFLTQALSVPLLVSLALIPSLTVITTIFLVRNAVFGLAQPLRNQLSMEFIGPKERGTTAGMTHMMFDLGGGVGAGIAGLLITGGGYTTAFAAAGLLVLGPAYLYYAWFQKLESRRREAAAPPALSGAGR